MWCFIFSPVEDKDTKAITKDEKGQCMFGVFWVFLCTKNLE